MIFCCCFTAALHLRLLALRGARLEFLLYTIKIRQQSILVDTDVIVYGWLIRAPGNSACTRSNTEMPSGKRSTPEFDSVCIYGRRLVTLPIFAQVRNKYICALVTQVETCNPCDIDSTTLEFQIEQVQPRQFL
jgi:hypothetical protein